MAPERPCLEDGSGVAIAHMFSLNSSPLILKEGDGTLIEEQVGVEDDDLTSLSWLVQNKNILKGINLKPGAAQTSPTSDFAEDGSSISEKSERGDSTSSSGIEQSISPNIGNSNRALSFPDNEQSVIKSVKTSKLKHPHHIPYDPMVHINSKPPYSFSCLIFMAIEDSPARALPVKQIYNWIQSHFPFYRNAPTGWKNSVRHNLSLNKCFCKVEKAPHLGKGSLWMVDPVFRPNLLQSISKAPVNNLTFLERPSNNLSNLGSSEMKANGNSSKYMSSVNHKTLNKVSRLPNAELFPFLSRRLAASGVEIPGVVRLGENNEGDSDDEEDEVDAAQAMLSLKHGPRVLGSKTDIYKRSYVRKMNSQRTRKSSIAVPVITSSPSEDHTYSAGANMSPDEAYGEGSDTDDGTEITPGHPSLPDELVPSDAEEQRRIAEGAADALLNLAGYRAKLNSPSESGHIGSRPHVSPEKSSFSKRTRRQRLPSDSSDTPRQQQLRSIRKREKLALEQELLDRKNIMKAEILADLAVIRNNNNVVLGVEVSKGSSSLAGSINSRSVKLKPKRRSISSFKPNIDINHLTSVQDSVRVTEQRPNSSQKRKHWSHDGSGRKSRR
ncbi:forkhead box protein N3 isoform X2 [Frankliniella occidentalis]|uniref:Forkhead box protein N3 isoform X2 n=1 Tax=Frankliniella occidentalis TaxID=133901 RepID=A0A6J1SL00_FRAOC|nr:forkhead box protein N3 isoform X2 [Frankliniella occidentalis]